MIATLRNIGSITEAVIDLDKKLTVFIGPNNTGKTYASYCLYGLKKFRPSYNATLVNEVFAGSDFETLFTTGVLNLELDKVFTKAVFNKILAEYSLQFKAFLPTLFGSKKDQFTSSSVELVFADRLESMEGYMKNFRFRLASLEFGKDIVSYSKDVGSSTLKISLQRQNFLDIDDQDADRSEMISTSVKRNIIDYTLRPFNNSHDIFFIPAERIGISVFGKDLFSARFSKSNEVFSAGQSELWDEVEDREKILQLISASFNTYSLVLQDSLERYDWFTRGGAKRASTRNSAEPFSSLADELEARVLKGRIRVAEDGNVYYDSEGSSSLKIQSTGSIVKSLASLVFYLRYSAAPGTVLIIDEPEINLHPDNQRIVARILAKLSNLGVQVIVSTHSDYIIRELNNLMMLGKEHPESENLREKYRYQKEETLNYQNVAGYLFRNTAVCKIDVTEKGMEAATIDEEINQLNASANDIYWTLFEEE